MFLYRAAAPHSPGSFHKTRNLPARFPWLSRVSLIIIAPPSAAAPPPAKLLSTTPTTTAPGTIRLGLRFVDLQRASAQFRSVQRRNRFIRFGGIRHFHKSKSPGASGFPVSYDADFFHRTMSFENGSQLGLGCAVGQITYIQILHCSSSLSKSSKLRDSAAARLTSLVSSSRGGMGRSCVALLRACDNDRTAEIRRE